MLWDFGAIFLRLLDSHRENKSVKEFVRFSTTDVFLYQLVNLVLETCLIFSKTLKLGKTCFCLEFLVEFDESNNERYDIPIPDYLFGIVFKKVLFLEYFTKSIVVSILGFFDTSLSERCFKLLTCKEIMTFWVSGVMLTTSKSYHG